MVVLANKILPIAVFLILGIAILESASTSKRVVYQTFFDNNLFLTCYGTCLNSLSGFASATRGFRCEGNRVRLKCNPENVIRVSFAFYGELEAGQEVCRDVSSLFEQCRKDVSNIVSRDCDGKGLCIFAVDKQRFGKFCQGQYFYLDIRYSCDFRPSTKEQTTSSTTTKGGKTTQIKTTPKAASIKPITSYKDETSKPSTTSSGRDEGDTTTKDRKTVRPSTDRVSTEKSTSRSSSSAATTHVPISSSGSSSNGKTTKSSAAVPKIRATLPTSLERSSNKKASLYWLLTAHSLVTDKGFIRANSTHLVLAIMLSIFIALVISVCFVLDHCRRVKRNNSLKELQEVYGGADDASHLENGSPLGFRVQQGVARPKSRSRANSVVGNGSMKHGSIHSLDEYNHDIENGGESFPLIPLRSQSSNSINRGSSKEPSYAAHSVMIDYLPPPPEELLLDTPKEDMGGYLDDNESETSTVSIPPPIGFADAGMASRTMSNVKPELKITSPSPTSSCVSASCATGFPSNKSLCSPPKIENSKRLNNELYCETPMTSHDSNLLHNSVSVQTNDLRDGGIDKKTRLDNTGQVSMKSPAFEISDICATVDMVSNIAAIDLEELNSKEMLSYRENSLETGQNMKKAGETLTRYPDKGGGESKNEGLRSLSKNDPSTKRGRLMILKSPSETAEEICDYKFDTSENKSDVIYESGKLPLEELRKSYPNGRYNEEQFIPSPVIPNGSLRSKENGKKYTENCTSIEMKVSGEKSLLAGDNSSLVDSGDSDLSVAPRFDAASQQIFAVPKHRCGMGHNHSCVCIPVRTGSSSFICSCLENAKYKSTKCCMEKCPDDSNLAGLPYTSRRASNGRGLATDFLRRKTYNNNSIKKTASLENIDKIQQRRKDARLREKYDDKDLICNDKARQNGKVHDTKSQTLPILQSKLKKSIPNTAGSKTLDRVHWGPNAGPRSDSKMIPVIVHTSRNKQTSRFEKCTGERSEDKVVSPVQKDPFRSNRSEDSDSSERSSSVEGQSISLPTTPNEKRRKKNGHARLSPISENSSRKTSTQDGKSWPKRSPRFRVQVVESVHYDKRKQSNEL